MDERLRVQWLFMSFSAARLSLAGKPLSCSATAMQVILLVGPPGDDLERVIRQRPL
jgi:hypothetical protein